MTNVNRSFVVLGIIAILLIFGGVDLFDKVWIFPGNFEIFNQYWFGRIPLLIYALLGTGVFVAFRFRFIQLRKMKHSVMVIAGKYDDPDDVGDLTHFRALSAALSATVGIGNIAGVALAIYYGGPGALVWMWITALFGMGLKFSECTLALHYREVHEDGSVSGGPMYYIERGLGPRFKWMAVAFATFGVLCSFGTGNAIQAFTVSDQIYSEVAAIVANPETHFLTAKFNLIGSFQVSVIQIINGFVLSSIVAAVIIGGIKRIGAFTSKIAPIMAIFYVSAALLIIFSNASQIGPAFKMIFQYAFSPPASVAGVTGGTFLIVFNTMLWGVKRGLFSNESGQGSAAIAHATAKTKYAVREGIVALAGPFIDTITICTLTGLVIITTGAWKHTEYYTTIVDPNFTGILMNSSVLTAFAFKEGLLWLFDYGDKIVTIAVFLFALSTAISWSYYGDRCAEYLWGAGAIPIYRWGFVIAHFIGAIASLEAIWIFGDAALGFMTFPNLIAIVLLSPVLVKLVKEYFEGGLETAT